MKRFQNRIGASIDFNRIARATGMIASTALVAIGCSSGQTPLSVKMVHPETKQTLTCSARDPLGRSDVSLLSGAVESCVRNLKSRGFVVEN